MNSQTFFKVAAITRGQFRWFADPKRSQSILRLQIVTNCYTGEKHFIAKVVNIQAVE